MKIYSGKFTFQRIAHVAICAACIALGTMSLPANAKLTKQEKQTQRKEMNERKKKSWNMTQDCFELAVENVEDPKKRAAYIQDCRMKAQKN